MNHQAVPLLLKNGSVEVVEFLREDELQSFCITNILTPIFLGNFAEEWDSIETPGPDALPVVGVVASRQQPFCLFTRPRRFHRVG